MEEETKELVYEDGMFDLRNPRSVASIVPDALTKAMFECQDIVENNDEFTIRYIYEPTSLDEDLRYNFWKEYERANMNYCNMKVSNIVNGVCSMSMFYKNIIKNTERLAYILIPQRNKDKMADAALSVGMSKLTNFLKTVELTLDDGNAHVIDTKKIDTYCRVYKMVHELRHGAVVKRNLNLNYEKKDKDNKMEPKTEEQLKKEIIEMDKKLEDMDAGNYDK